MGRSHALLDLPASIGVSQENRKHSIGAQYFASPFSSVFWHFMYFATIQQKPFFLVKPFCVWQKGDHVKGYLYIDS